MSAEYYYRRQLGAKDLLPAVGVGLAFGLGEGHRWKERRGQQQPGRRFVLHQRILAENVCRVGRAARCVGTTNCQLRTLQRKTA